MEGEEPGSSEQEVGVEEMVGTAGAAEKTSCGHPRTAASGRTRRRESTRSRSPPKPGSQAPAFLQGEPTIPSGGHGPFVVFGVYHDGNRIVILRGGTHH